MAGPTITTVEIDGMSFNAFSTQFALFTPADGLHGMPMMGASQTAIEVVADMHDNENLTFDKVRAFFDLSHHITRDKIKDIKIIYWVDDKRRDSLSTFTFKGWISSFTILSGSGQNHALIIKLQPSLDPALYIDIKHGN